MTALRTGAAAVLAAETLGRDGDAAVIGAGVNGRAVARTFAARGGACSSTTWTKLGRARSRTSSAREVVVA